MSAPSCVVFFGLRFSVADEELESLEDRTHPHIMSARKSGLKFYWGNFGSPGENNLLFIGAQIGVLGPENDIEVALPEDDLSSLLEKTGGKLKSAGFSERPSLYLQWMPDV